MNSSRRIQLFTPSPADAVFSELGEMLADAFRRLGCAVEVCRDGQALSEANLVILFGECLRLQRSRNNLRARSGRRQSVILWQMEPFPPPDAFKEDKFDKQPPVSEEVLWFLEKSAMKLFRPFFPEKGRKALRRIENRLRVRGRDPKRVDESDRLYWGAKRFKRVEWIRDACGEGWLDRVFVSAPERTVVLANCGLPSEFLPLGYHPLMGHDYGHERPIDVVFLGRVKDDRREFLSHLDKNFRSRGITFHIEQGPCYGEDRVELLNRAKISLNLHGLEREFVRMRALFSMACGALVVSEVGGNTSPFVAGEHFASSPREEMVDTIEQLLADGKRRTTLVASARRFIHSDLTMEAIALKIAAAEQLHSSEHN